jgi:hypothetical protein
VQVMMVITHEGDFETSDVTHLSEYSHYPRVDYYTFSTTMKRN